MHGICFLLMMTGLSRITLNSACDLQSGKTAFALAGAQLITITALNTTGKGRIF
jgi:hypothetical protein